MFVPSRLLAAALMFEEAVPASAAVRPLPPPSHTHPFLSSTLSAKTLSETERERERELREYARQQVRGECVNVRGSDSEYMCEKGSLGGISPEMNFKKWASRLPISHVLYSPASFLLSHHALLLLLLAGAMTDGRRGVGLINTRLTARLPLHRDRSYITEAGSDCGWWMFWPRRALGEGLTRGTAAPPAHGEVRRLATVL